MNWEIPKLSDRRKNSDTVWVGTIKTQASGDLSLLMTEDAIYLRQSIQSYADILSIPYEEAVIVLYLNKKISYREIKKSFTDIKWLFDLFWTLEKIIWNRIIDNTKLISNSKKRLQSLVDKLSNHISLLLPNDFSILFDLWKTYYNDLEDINSEWVTPIVSEIDSLWLALYKKIISLLLDENDLLCCIKLYDFLFKEVCDEIRESEEVSEYLIWYLNLAENMWDLEDICVERISNALESQQPKEIITKFWSDILKGKKYRFETWIYIYAMKKINDLVWFERKVKWHNVVSLPRTSWT